MDNQPKAVKDALKELKRSSVKDLRPAIAILRRHEWSEVRIQASLFAAGHRQPKVSHILSK